MGGRVVRRAIPLEGCEPVIGVGGAAGVNSRAEATTEGPSHERREWAEEEPRGLILRFPHSPA